MLRLHSASLHLLVQRGHLLCWSQIICKPFAARRASVCRQMEPDELSTPIETGRLSDRREEWEGDPRPARGHINRNNFAFDPKIKKNEQNAAHCLLFCHMDFNLVMTCDK